MKLFKKLSYLVLTLLIASVLIVPAFGVEKEDIADAQNKQRELEQQLEDSEALLESLRQDVEKAKQEVEEIDGQIAAVEAVISDYQTQEADLQVRIEELQAQIDQKQIEINHEYELMKKRIKFLYENLDNSYAEIILTSESFADALNNVQYLIDLTEYDREMMNKLQEMQNDIVADQDLVEQEKYEVEVLLQAQNDQKAVLDGMLEIKAEALGVAMDAEANVEEQNAAIAAMIEEQKDTIDALVKEYNETHPIAPPTPGGGVDVNAIIVTTGALAWPLPSPYGSGYITSPFGWRGNPFGGGGGDFHGGLDIGAPCDTPILAVLDGQVIISQDGWNGGCGNYTVIYHGGGLYTEYMHQNYRIVSPGETVAKGQVIGYVGTTGSSTGYHLHLGVITSDHGFDTSCRIDPLAFY